MSKYVDPTTGKPVNYVKKTPEKEKEEEKREKRKKSKVVGKYVDPTTGKPVDYVEKTKPKPTPRGRYIDPTTGKPPDVETPEKARQEIEKAREAIKQAESYSESWGSKVQWGDRTYDLGTTQGWRDYRQALRDARSELSDYERQVREWRLSLIGSRTPEPATARLSRQPTEVGPPKQATEADLRQLRAEGYDLPTDRTIYLDTAGEPFYYLEEPTEPRKTLSMRLWESAQRFEETATGRFLDFLPYSKKGIRQIGAIMASGAERTATGLFGFIPGEQPLEVMPDETGFDWRSLGFNDLPKGKLFAARATGMVTEQALGFGAYAAAGYGAGAVIGASGAVVSRLPYVGPALEAGGGKVVQILGTRAGQLAITLPIVAVEGLKVSELVSSGKPRWKIAAELEIEAVKVFGGAYGFSRGLGFGKQLPTKVEQIITRGKVIPEEAFVPEYVRGGGDFPKFSEEPYPPTARGYREMAESYTPEDLRIIEEAVPSYHATAGRLEGMTPEGFITQVGKRPGEGGMFWAPAGSKHFLRLDSGYSLRPGVPNLFSESQWVYGEFPGVAETGLSKTSPELAKILEETAGTGKLFMPTGQLGEAQAMLGPGTEMVSVPGSFYAEMGGKTVKIGRYLPKKAADLFGVKGPTVSAESLVSRSSLLGEQPTTYLPILTSKTKVSESKTVERVSVSKPSKPSKATETATSIIGKPSSTIPSIVSVTGVTETGKPSRGKPSRGRPEPSPTPSEARPTDITGISGTSRRGTPSKTPPIYKVTQRRGPPATTTKRPPDIFEKKKSRKTQAVDIFGSRRYGYRVPQAKDIIGTTRRGKAPPIKVFNEEPMPDIFGSKKKKRSVKIF